MARINIDIDIVTDPRFFKFALKLGSRDEAMGCLIFFWIIAQEYWKKNKSLIPKHKFKELGRSDLLLKFGFAEEKVHGIYAKGSDRHFDWIINKQIAGKRGGISKANNIKKLGSSTAKQNPSTAKQNVPNSNSNYNNNNNKKYIETTNVVSHPISMGSGQILSIWNTHKKTLPEVRKVNASRQKKMDARWKEFPDHDFWTLVVKKIAESDFCNGKNKNAWIATFDWLLQPDTAIRVEEGKYDNRSALRGQSLNGHLLSIMKGDAVE